VDFYSAGLFHALGIPAESFTSVLSVARMAGWTAHIIEQQHDNRLFRPDSDYSGPPPRAFVPLSAR
jgi:2-methylcitrate synthase